MAHSPRQEYPKLEISSWISHRIPSPPETDENGRLDPNSRPRNRNKTRSKNKRFLMKNCGSFPWKEKEKEKEKETEKEKEKETQQRVDQIYSPPYHLPEGELLEA
jgi:hypothetical protein